MKNLELLNLIHNQVDAFDNVKIFAETSDAIYFIRDNILQKFEFTNGETIELCPQIFEDVIQLKFLTIENKICIVTPVNVHIFDPNGTKELQSVTVDEDIDAISWNPTEELVAIASRDGSVGTYSIDYENAEVFSQGHSSINAKIPDTVYVGWGSKETQFRGSEGKLKKPLPVVEKPVEFKNPVISWRGNGEMFVVNYWDDYKRKFVVFESPCKALYRSEECLGLQPVISWRPAGNMIATVTEIDGKQSVVIFEKNGQKRFTFDLDFGSVRVSHLKWSHCAQILTICTENLETRSQNLHLLMSSNYKWYEKQRLSFKSDNKLLDFDWLETTQFTFTLRVVTPNDILDYIFHTKVHDCDAVCAVIDGKNLQLTDFKDAIVPPIMSSKLFLNDTAINFVVVKNDTVVIVDAENHLKAFDIDTFQIITSANLGDLNSNYPLSCSHFVSQGNDTSFMCGTAVYCLDNGEVRQLSNDNLCENVGNLVRREVKIIDNRTYNCQLNSKCHFYVNDNKLSDCVNSFIIFDQYLLYTTKLNELHCLRFNEESFKNQIYRRNIEQGATIVTAIPNSPKIVLQLPRGNLETISCRLISIDILDKLLNDQKWEEALRFIRLEKLNANLLFDLDPRRFLGQIDRFINGAKTISELNSFCLEFEDGNVLTTIYKNWGNRCDAYPGKIDAIFGGIFEFFDTVDYATYITTIMIINLNFFTLRNALVYLQDLLRRDVTLRPKLVEAVNTLKTYGCDQDKLYAEALLLYDLELAHFLASCCQLDPRIYEPHLNELKNLTEVERRYEINVFGKKPKVAVAYLLRCPGTTQDQVGTFIKNHNVSKEAYENCPQTNRFYQLVGRAFAHDLSRRGLHEEAGLILKRGGLLEEALEEFKLSLQWKEVMNLLEELKTDEVEKTRVVNDVAKRLCQNHVIKDAAILYEYYARNYEMAVKILIENYHFEDALHLAKKHNRGDIIVSEIIPTLYKHKTYLEEKSTDLGQVFDKYKTRLLQVRRDRVAKLDGDEGDDRDDLFSDVGSTITKSSRSSKSRSSTASSRHRRKEEKKKQDLREGGVYEDIALIRALHGTIREIYRRGEEVRTCCTLLMQESDVSYREMKRFYDLYWEVVDKVKSGVGDVWPPHLYANNQTQDVQEVADLENFEHLDVEYRTPPTCHSSWKLNFFS